MFKTTRLILALSFAAMPVWADTTWTHTGSQGGTAQGQVSCNATTTTVTCTQSGTYTSPAGRVLTRQATRIGTPDQVTVTGTVTGPRGKTATTTRIRSR
jgi:hypothetical protein